MKACVPGPKRGMRLDQAPRRLMWPAFHASCLRVSPVLAAAVFATSSTAAIAAPGASAPTQDALAAIENQAAALPVAGNASEAVAEAQELLPAVSAAIAANPSNQAALLQTGNQPIAAALLLAEAPSDGSIGGTSLASATAGLGGSGIGPAQIPSALQAADPCWTTYVYGYEESLGDLAKVKVSIDGWCGNGVSVTSHGAVRFQVWDNGPYCAKDCSETQGYSPGPDGPHVWYDASISADIGITYVWGCAGITTYSAYADVKGNGYYDGH